MSKVRHQYYITYEKDGGGYIASVPAIPGCVVYGKTLKSAYKNALSAIKECLEVRQDYNRKSPRETIDPESIRRFSFARIN